ncbi:MAG: hypothetical protein ACE5HZ_01220 [Fidelibacterota bacterium]
MNLSGQQPDYDIGGWVEGDFDRQARPFFSTLALQTSLGGMPSPSSTERLAVGFLLASGASRWAGLSPGMGTPGIIPAVYGHYRVTSNLAVNGLYSGFVSGEDVVILTRYGLNLKVSPDRGISWVWMIQILMGNLQGPDDFFLKTVDAGLARGINYRGLEGWIGLGLNGFDAGIHIRNSDPQLNLSKRMKGQITTIFFGIRRRVASGVEGTVEANLGSSSLGLGIGIRKLIG